MQESVKIETKQEKHRIKNFLHNVKGSRKVAGFTIVLAIITLILLIILYSVGYTSGFPGSYNARTQKNRIEKETKESIQFRQGPPGVDGDKGDIGPKGRSGPPGIYSREAEPFEYYECGITNPIFYVTEKTGIILQFQKPIFFENDNQPTFLFQVFNRLPYNKATWNVHLSNYIMDDKESQKIWGLNLIIQRTDIDDDGNSILDWNTENQSSAKALPFIHYFIFKSRIKTNILYPIQLHNSNTKLHNEFPSSFPPLSKYIRNSIRRLSEFLQVKD